MSKKTYKQAEVGMLIKQQSISRNVQIVGLCLGIIVSLIVIISSVHKWLFSLKSVQFYGIILGEEKPLSDAVVIFNGNDTTPITAKTDKNGRYCLKIKFGQSELIGNLEIRHEKFKNYSKLISLKKNALKIPDIKLESKMQTKYILDSDKKQKVKPELQKIKTIRGQVIDSDGNPLALVQITIMARSEGDISDHSGNFMITIHDNFQNLPITLVAVKKGYKTLTRSISVGEIVKLMMIRDD